MPLTASITTAQKYQLTASPLDAANNPAPLPGPIQWALNDSTLGAISPSADTLGCLFSPTLKAGVAKVFANVPSAPSIPVVEADITISPLAVRLALQRVVV